MHPAVYVVGGIGAALAALRFRVVLLGKSKSLNDPAQRPPPADDAATRAKQQDEIVKQAIAADPPQRQFQVGEIVGVDIFAAGFEISTMSDVQNPRPGLIKGIVNMKVTDISDPFNPPQVPEDKAKIGKFIRGVFADQRFFVQPFFNDNGTQHQDLILKAAIAPAPNPEGGTSGNQGFMDPAKEALAIAALVASGGNEFQAQINPLSGQGGTPPPAVGGLQAQINPTSLPKAKVTTNDPAPLGDLVMRISPSETAAQVPGGGADKDGIVTILEPNADAAGVFAKVQWDGGRRPAAVGFAKKKYLVAV